MLLRAVSSKVIVELTKSISSLCRLEGVKQQVNLLSQELVHNLLSDPTILSKALFFLEQIMENPSTKDTLIRLLQRLMIDEQMQKNVADFTSAILYDVMKKPETEFQLGQLFRRAILQKDNQDALYILLKDLINDQKTKDILANLGQELAHQVLNDESVKIAATNFAKDVLNDTGLQEQSGDFAWKTVKHALKPKWFTSHAKSDEKIKISVDFENSIVLP